MTNDEFKDHLRQFKNYLKPALFTVLTENADIFSEVTKQEIVDKLTEADNQVKELHDYQEKRNSILRTGLETIDGIYSKAKIHFQSVISKHKKEESAKADRLISNL
ncbi:hypothetical protein JXD20_00630 [Candidatus Peregrinibacteria bacterium]|nr:hypothetical protein [Candidatus Peregrinibacteria bacterium]